jgi:hypothetical protein
VLENSIKLHIHTISITVSLSKFLFSTGFIARFNFFDPLDENDFYLDAPYWEVSVLEQCVCSRLDFPH